MTDMAELLGDAERRGFTVNFALEGGRLRCPETGDCFAQDDVKLIYTQSVDMGTDPGDDATIYLIEMTNGRKGYLMVADSFHVDPGKAEFVQKLVRKRGTEAAP